MKRTQLIISASFTLLLLCVVVLDAFEFRANRANRRRGHHRHRSTRSTQVSFENCISGEADCDDLSGIGKKASNPAWNETTGVAAARGRSEAGLIGPAAAAAKSRGRRGTYAWPDGTLFIADFSLEMPLFSPDSVSVPLLLEIQYTFNLPNVTESIITGRHSKNHRRSVLGTIESLFSRFGLEGRECVLRAICERAENKVLLSGGLLGEVLDLLLVIPATEEVSVSLDEYRDAEHHGRTYGDCASKFSTCSMSIFHFFD